MYEKSFAIVLKLTLQYSTLLYILNCSFHDVVCTVKFVCTTLPPVCWGTLLTFYLMSVFCGINIVARTVDYKLVYLE